jgi:hypothetical protein
LVSSSFSEMKSGNSISGFLSFFAVMIGFLVKFVGR